MFNDQNIITVETNRGSLTVREALETLKSGNILNSGFSQVVYGVYGDGRKTSLKGRRDGLYYMSGNLAASL